MTKLDDAEKHRDSVKATITWLQTKVAVHATTPLSIIEVNHYINEVEKSKAEVYETHRKIVNCSPADMDPYTTEYYTILDMVSDLQVQLLTISASIMVTTPVSTIPTVTTKSSTDIRLPRLQIPTFDGNLSDWMSFRDMFVAAVHTNASLSNAEKFQYLKSILTGEAARQVKSMSVTNHNYNIAWKLMEERYQNDRELLFSILRRFMGQPSIQSVTATTLRSMIDVSKECFRSLEAVKVPVDQWDGILLFHMFQKLDSTTKELWEQSLKDSAIPPLQDFMDFLEQRSRALAAGSSGSTSGRSTGKTSQSVSQAHHVQPTRCKLCSDAHPLFKCSNFHSKTTAEKIEVVKKNYLCFNCLREGHSAGQCPSGQTCRTCKGRHHTLIHKERASTDPPSKGKEEFNGHINDDTQITQSLLATAMVRVQDSFGKNHLCRVLIDGGSTSSFITNDCVKRLGLRRQTNSTGIVGLTSSSIGTAKGMVSINLAPHFMSKDSYVVRALILPSITGLLPSYPCDPTVWPHLQGLELADPEYNKPASIDILLGADIFWSSLMDGKRVGPKGAPVACRTTLGWLIAGALDSVSTISRAHYADSDLDKTLQQFWELEAVPSVRVLTMEEKACEDHFASTHRINHSGRFIVQLPMKDPKPALGSSREIAVRRLRQLERRLSQKPDVRQQYNEFMQEYLSSGHMELVPEEEMSGPNNTICYIPHHFILKESSTTTKLRAVFDASAATATGVSLNDTMMMGPALQDHLLNIVIRFRKHPIAFTADIAKMYRQILVSKEDANLQRILWRENPLHIIQDYRLLTVTYGTKSAPYLAIKVLQQLATNNESCLPLATAVILSDTYVDDVISGTETVQEGLKIQSQLHELMGKGGFCLRKWSSNCNALLECLPDNLRESQSITPIDDEQIVKTLGLYWNTATDQYLFKVKLSSMETLNEGRIEKMTKRELLSEMSKVFDPSGWLAPVTINAKIMFQQVWKLNIGWDQPLPLQLQQQWKVFRSNLPLIEQIRIRRCIIPPGYKHLSLIGFCDASERAYAGVVYLRAAKDEFDTHPVISLVIAKTRVAPAKTITLVRLELCGAVILSQLLTTAQSALKIDLKSVSAWTDSTVVLAYIRDHPSRWKTFVANRVTEIQEQVPSNLWGHVKGVDNPADCASRGLDPSELQDHPLWFHGPSWLQNGIVSPDSTGVIDFDQTILEERKPKLVCANAALQHDDSLIYKFSSISKLKRVTAWCRRFLSNLKTKGRMKTGKYQQNGIPDPLTPFELDEALLMWIKTAQQQMFHSEIESLIKKSKVSTKSRISPLCPFLDTVGILRVGGRLRHSKLPQDQRTPILLPRYHTLTQLLIMSTHLQNFHAGPQLLQSILTRRYWIVGARDAISYGVKKCVICTRHSAKTMQTFMGDLPAVRVTAARAFLKCGVDYAGPFTMRPIPGRSKVTYKAYLALFICLTTRAVHLELVSSLNTDAFIATFRRFIARRGKPTDMYSDQGTNFVGANRELKEMLVMVKNDDHNNKIAINLANDGIQWHFNPPGAPHFGGLWEAGVKSVKHHLYRVVGSARLTFEELTTTFAQIEACLNSRPLTPMSSDPSDLSALTPGHFLIGNPLTAAPDPDLTGENTGRLSRWQVIQQMCQGFWHRWSNEFITRLQQRPKWLNHPNKINIGDLVLIKDERLPPLKWNLGRVIKTHPGPDGVVRVLTLKTAEGELKRPLVKLCLLPIDPVKINDSTSDSDTI